MPQKTLRGDRGGRRRGPACPAGNPGAWGVRVGLLLRVARSRTFSAGGPARVADHADLGSAAFDPGLRLAVGGPGTPQQRPGSSRAGIRRGRRSRITAPDREPGSAGDTSATDPMMLPGQGISTASRAPWVRSDTQTGETSPVGIDRGYIPGSGRSHLNTCSSPPSITAANVNVSRLLMLPGQGFARFTAPTWNRILSAIRTMATSAPRDDSPPAPTCHRSPSARCDTLDQRGSTLASRPVSASIPRLASRYVRHLHAATPSRRPTTPSENHRHEPATTGTRALLRDRNAATKTINSTTPDLRNATERPAR
jgi:hypothetical protein